MVNKKKAVVFNTTSPAKFIDLQPPAHYVKPVEPTDPISSEEVINWSFNHIALKQYEDTRDRVHKDIGTTKGT